MIKKNVKIRENEFRIEIEEMPGNILRVEINDKDYFFSSDNGSMNLVGPSALEEVMQGNISRESKKVDSKILKSPLSGTISVVWVKDGEDVKRGQKLVTIVAMKMENELVAEGDMVIKEVKAQKDKVVTKNESLIIFN
ncbi:MAG: biotin/lipoyl-containing protein [Candidatus Paceibacterota bacterium]